MRKGISSRLLHENPLRMWVVVGLLRLRQGTRLNIGGESVKMSSLAPSVFIHAYEKNEQPNMV